MLDLAVFRPQVYFPVTVPDGGDPRVEGTAYTVHYEDPRAVPEDETPPLE